MSLFNRREWENAKGFAESFCDSLNSSVFSVPPRFEKLLNNLTSPTRVRRNGSFIAILLLGT